MQAYESPAGVIHTDATIGFEITDLATLMLGASPDGIALVDQATLIVRVINDSALALLSASANSLIGCVMPLALTDQEPQELRIEREQLEAIIISVHKQEINRCNQLYWLLSIRNVTSRVQLREQLRSESINDDLTSLLNRRGFIALGQHAISLAEREKRRLLVVFIDLDGMKGINDRFGHHIGNEALVTTADLLRQTFRKSDVVARMGGDEFAVIAQCKNEQDSEHIQRRLSENLEAINKVAEGPYKLCLSVGLVEYNASDRCGLESLLEQADAAMYEAKRLKRNPPRLPNLDPI